MNLSRIASSQSQALGQRRDSPKTHSDQLGSHVDRQQGITGINSICQVSFISYSDQTRVSGSAVSVITPPASSRKRNLNAKYDTWVSRMDVYAQAAPSTPLKRKMEDDLSKDCIFTRQRPRTPPSAHKDDSGILFFNS